MAIFRVEKTSDYTVMSNNHLKNARLSLKAKGLLSVVLSLPDGWDYTLKGLARISLEGVDAIRKAMQELEAEGYIVRFRVRNEKGQLTDAEYVIYEKPDIISLCRKNRYRKNQHRQNLCRKHLCWKIQYWILLCWKRQRN